MAEVKFISVKVCGNPSSNAGFQPLILLNNPAINIKDDTYAGFDSNSYFYTVVIEQNKVVYTLVKNNVRSHGAFRAGSLKIAMSVPKGYKFDGNIGPAEVLKAILDSFIAKCMTCKDPVRETYEYNSDMIDPNAINGIVQQFPLVPCAGMYVPMRPGAPVGYVAVNAEKISQLLSDVQYTQFASYSMVIVAEAAINAPYTEILDIQIPRPQEYAIIVDGVHRGSTYDLSQQLSFAGKADNRFYVNENVVVTIGQLIGGTKVKGVQIDVPTRKVIVTTSQMSTPIRKVVPLKFASPQIEQYFRSIKNSLALTHKGRNIPLNPDLSFNLDGEAISALYTIADFKLSVPSSCEYTVKALSGGPSGLNVIADKRQVTGGGPRPGGGQRPVHNGPRPGGGAQVYTVTMLMGKDAAENCKYAIVSYESTGEEVQKERLHWLPAEGGRFKSEVMIRNKFNQRLVLSLASKKKDYTVTLFKGADQQLTEYDFDVHNKDFYELYIRPHFGILIAFVAILLLGGGAAGFFLFKDKIFGGDKSTDIELIADGGGDNGDTTDGSEATQSGPLTPEQIKKDLAEADSILKNSDEHLSFSEVERLYNKICQSDKSAEYNSANPGVFARVKDYGEAVQAIKGQDFNKIKELSERKFSSADKLHMWPQHVKCFEKIQLACPSRGINSYKPAQRTKAQNFVREHVSELNLFSDLNRIDSLFTGASPDETLGRTPGPTPGRNPGRTPGRTPGPTPAVGVER